MPDRGANKQIPGKKLVRRNGRSKAGPVFVDLFCGAGGLSLGLASAGWTPGFALDVWDEALQTHRKNFSDHEIWRRDVSRIAGADVVKTLGDAPEWVVGGPPCQGFSTVGKRERSDPRNSLVGEFIRLVSELRPRCVLMENVLGLRDLDFVDKIKAEFARVGYEIECHEVRAADYGVPQLRRRVMFIGRDDGAVFRLPKPTHSENDFVTVWDAIGDLPELGAGESTQQYHARPFTKYQRRMRGKSTRLQGHVASKHPDYLVKAISFIPDGGNRRDIPDAHQPKSGFHNSYSRLDSQAPAVAVTQNMGKPSGTRCIHPFQHRGLTAREGARLQSFPDRFHFSGGMVSQRLQIANSVPPLLAEALGKNLVNEANWSKDRDGPGRGIEGNRTPV